jgi:hypothetical protein
MRRTLTVCRAGLSVTAAVALLAACGGGSDRQNSAASASSTAASSSAASAATGSKFCTDATNTLNGLAPAFSSSTAESDPASLAPVLKKAATSVRAIQPPAEIGGDWATLADGLDQFASAYASVNVNDPASASAFQKQNSTLLAKLTTAVTHVQGYMVKNCGLSPATPTSAAPSS